ncbi:NUDIX hydrolase [Patescibacteria group bacterium]|nr:NUDIX hydrolase [Patescibacteria group bacterium]
MKKATVQKKDIILDKFGKTLVKERLIVSDGSELDWYYLDTPSSVLVVPLTAKRELLLVKLYRYNLKKAVYELPAGSFDVSKESLLKSSKRELKEETGYTAKELIALGKHYVLPSETNRWIYVVLALDVKKQGEPQLDDVIEKYFDMSIELVDFDETVKKMGRKDSIIKGAESGYAILLADMYLKQPL